jgi:prevent-host-death family protein
MKEETISVTEAARNFSECVNRARYQDVTFILVKNGEPMARIVPEKKEKGSTKALAAALREFDLSPEEAKAWHGDLRAARRILKPPADKWKR